MGWKGFCLDLARAFGGIIIAAFIGAGSPDVRGMGGVSGGFF